MPATIIDGKKIAVDMKTQVKEEIDRLGYAPGLAVFLIGQDEPSHLYVSLKEKACQQMGIDFHKYFADANVSQKEIIASIKFLNQDPNVDAILVQVPVPPPLDQQAIIEAIDPAKDVDGFHPQTVKHFLAGKTTFMPGLTQGIVRLIESTGEALNGKDAVVVAKSDIFFQPLEKALKEKGLSVKKVHPDASDLIKHMQGADVLITAIGKPHAVKADMIKKGAIVIDVGIAKVDGKTLGDVDFEDVRDKAGYVTPVPGGVGPVTVAMLLENTVRLAKKNQGA